MQQDNREAGAPPLTFGLNGEQHILRPKRAEPPRPKRRGGIKTAAATMKYIFYFGLMTVLWLGRVAGLSPFASGFFYALLFVGESAFVLTPLYILAAFLSDLSLTTFLSAVITGGVLFALSLTRHILKKRTSLPFMMITAVISQLGYMYFSYLAGSMILVVLLNLVLSLLFFYCATVALKPLFKYRLKYRLIDVELACLGIVLSAAALGFAALNVGQFRFIYLIAYACVLGAAHIAGKSTGLVTALCFGIGASVYGNDIAELALFGFVGLVTVVFVGAPRILTALAGLFALILFKLYFTVGVSTLLYDMAAIGSGGVIFALVPHRVFRYIKENYFLPHNRYAARYLINRSREEVSNELKAISAVYQDMCGLLIGGAAEDIEGEDLGAAARQSVCAACPSFSTCAKKNLTAAVEQLSTATVKNGRAYVTDLPLLIALDCTQIARLIAFTGNEHTARLAAVNKRKEDNRLKTETANQLFALTEMIVSAANKMNRQVSYDPELESVLIEELSHADILCSEALLTRGDGLNVTLIVRSECADAEKARAVLERVLRVPLSVDDEKESRAAGYSVLTFALAPQFDAVFGVASSSKNQEATGDTYSFTRIGTDRFMMALSDGMGHGSAAGRISDAAISLIESFYRAGFPSELILSTVNRFLIYAEGDAFSALDIMTVDLNSLECDLIKTGTPATFIKRGDETVKIESRALPLGMVNEMTPSVHSETLKVGDCVIFCSDGVTDCFDEGALDLFLSRATDLNPKTLAESVLDESEKQRKGKKEDDRTVLVCRLI